MSNPTTIAVPIKLDAFILNKIVCEGDPDTDDSTETPSDPEAPQRPNNGSKIAPITQPNYTFLRLKNHVLQPDILDLHDLHNASPASRNPRLTDLGTGEELRHRQGAYLHWSVPRVYRSGMAATPDAPDNSQHDGITPPEDDRASGDRDQSAPLFRQVPTRWLVVRRLHPGTAKPEGSEIPEVQAWVVESDRLRDINDLGLDVDLQTEVSPYVAPTGNITIDRQAEVFIGEKFDSEIWEESEADRVPVSLLTGGNMLFADYQPHNSNVFSIIDNFSYTKNGETQYLSEARASYYVIGWHSVTKDDPFHGGESEDKLERLGACLMQLNNPESEFAKEWLALTGSTEVLCHGAMYEVDWNDCKRPETVLADLASKKLHSDVPVAVGTTPLDSLLAYVDGQREHEPDGVMKKLMDSIVKIQTLLIDKDDSVDAQRAAEDLLYNYNYQAAPGGTRWYFGGSANEGQPVTPPSEAMIRNLDRLNDLQFHLDVVLRTQQDTRWELFARWWKYVSFSKNQESDYKNQVKEEVKEITARIKQLEQIANGEGGLAGDINFVLENGRLRDDPRGKMEDELLFVKLVKKEVMQNYYEQLDPTVMVAGIESAWPDDYMELLKVRPPKEISSWGDDQTVHNGIDWTKLVKSEKDSKPPTAIVEKLPTSLQKTAQALLAEFFRLMPNSEGKVDDSKGDKTYFPQFHDQGGSDTKPTEQTAWRDRWGGRQPWFPLIMEWEVQYYHVTVDHWSLDERLSSSTDKVRKLRYGIKDKIVLKEEHIEDVRTLTGRVLILPQAGFSLKSKIDDILDNTPPPILAEYIDDKDRALLETELGRLKFLSAPFSGLHDHLVTRSQGAHLKPNIRRAGEKLTPLGDAKDGSAGFGDEQFRLIDTETDLTPYGSLVRPDSKHSLFKPATHGQFRITKLNIIDKFGQAIHATDPRWSVTLPPPIYPYISEYYAPQFLELEKGGKKYYRPNTIDYDENHEGSEYVQLPPHMNQLARVNASFVTRNIEEEMWRPQHEWENPIWGWLVINYAQYGIQAFLPDGRFYREIQLGGFGGTRTSEKYLPFGRPDKPTETRQLDSLLDKLGATADNLQSFVDMINGAIGKTAPAPEAYAQFLNSIVGKPLALVNVGWSLEIATPEYTSQNTNQGEALPERYILEHFDDINHEKLPQYSFKFKLGDEGRAYDGLLGYFDTLEKRKDDGNDLDLDNLYTFFKPNEKGPWTVKIKPDNYPEMPAYHTPALVRKPLGGGWDSNTTKEISDKRNQMLKSFGVVMDPFTPIHLYSGILPIKELRLPTWTWQDAMSRMTAFFRVGPLLQAKDVEAFNKDYILNSDYRLGDNEIPNVQKNHKGVIVPGIQEKDGWRWLQPYINPVTGEDGTTTKEQVYMPLMVQPVVGVGLENGPYKALEGYLQLQKAIVRK
ncbi:hypothetical protein BGX38DRAFT_761779 [Terfezia claveryi]|nr:hypothetical protein BGX38DRAFT_761779 [Terfezia claveryi]